jgi:hypothetical protein
MQARQLQFQLSNRRDKAAIPYLFPVPGKPPALEICCDSLTCTGWEAGGLGEVGGVGLRGFNKERPAQTMVGRLKSYDSPYTIQLEKWVHQEPKTLFEAQACPSLRRKWRLEMR